MDQNLLTRKQPRKYSEKYISILSKELVRLGKKASGKLIKSLREKFNDATNAIEILITSEKYLEFVDKGRKPGRFPPLQAIQAWCRIRRIPKAAAFPIAKKIYKFGIKPTNVIQKANKRWEKEIKPDVEKDMAKAIEKEIVKNLKQK